VSVGTCVISNVFCFIIEVSVLFDGSIILTQFFGIILDNSIILESTTRT